MWPAAFAIAAGLKTRGHTVAVRPLPLGGGQAIQIDWDRGILIGDRPDNAVTIATPGPRLLRKSR